MLDRRWFVVTVFFLFPMLVYWLVITQGTGNLFAPTYGWHAYNEYALAMASGRTDIPAEAIGAEGLYIDGRVYLYYGILPALARFVLMPFIDLRVVPVSNLLVWLMVVIGQSALQVALLRVYRTVDNGRLLLVLASIALWFSSGAFLIVANGTLYHEPYAAALMLAEIVLAMLANDLIVRRREMTAARLICYATLAGLSVFTRQTFAVGLYAIAVGLLWPSEVAGLTMKARLAVALRRGTIPLLVMLVAGLAFLSLGHARTGHFGAGWNINNYGYYLIGSDRPRLETLRDQQFSPVRIVPNFVYILVGGAEFREQAIAKLGGGYVRSYFSPVRYLLFAPCTLLIGLLGAMSLWRRARGGDPRRLMVTAGLAVMALLQLSYGTMNWRYTAELWPLLAWLMLCAVADPGFDSRRLRLRRTWLAAATALTTISLAYTIKVLPLLQRGDRNMAPGSLEQPLDPLLAKLATAPGSRDPTILSPSSLGGVVDPLVRR
jgi:hypothetical protein